MMNLLRRRALMMSAVSKKSENILYAACYDTTPSSYKRGIFKIDVDTGEITQLNATNYNWAGICDLGNNKLMLAVYTTSASTTGRIYLFDLKTNILTPVTTTISLRYISSLHHDIYSGRILISTTFYGLYSILESGVVSTIISSNNYGFDSVCCDSTNFYLNLPLYRINKYQKWSSSGSAWSSVGSNLLGLSYCGGFIWTANSAKKPLKISANGSYSTLTTNIPANPMGDGHGNGSATFNDRLFFGQSVTFANGYINEMNLTTGILTPITTTPMNIYALCSKYKLIG